MTEDRVSVHLAATTRVSQRRDPGADSGGAIPAGAVAYLADQRLCGGCGHSTGEHWSAVSESVACTHQGCTCTGWWSMDLTADSGDAAGAQDDLDSVPQQLLWDDDERSPVVVRAEAWEVEPVGGPAAVGATEREVDPPVTGVGGGRWHGVDRVYPPCAGEGGQWGRAVCGDLVAVAGRFGVFDPDRFPGGTCLECTWRAAITAGTVMDRIRALADVEGPPRLAARVAEAIVAGASCDLDHPHAVQLLVAVGAHAPAGLLDEACADCHGCGHTGVRPCPPAVMACLACSEQAGSWAGEREGFCLPEVTIAAPCEVLRALAAHYRVTGGAR